MNLEHEMYNKVIILDTIEIADAVLIAKQYAIEICKKQRIDCGQRYFSYADEPDSIKLRDYIFYTPLATEEKK